VNIYQTKAFFQWAKKHEIEDTDLTKTICEIETGLAVVNLGSHLYKKRMATKGRGKSGSVRTILAYKKDSIAFFLYGYEKGEKDNLSTAETDALKHLAKVLLTLTTQQREYAINHGEMKEVAYVR